MPKYSVYLQCKGCGWSEPGEVGEALSREITYEQGRLHHGRCGGEVRVWGFNKPIGEKLDLKFTRHHRGDQTVVIVHLVSSPKMADVEPMSQYKAVAISAHTHREST